MFTDLSKAVRLLWIICVFICLLFVMISRLFIAALWSPAGKGLNSWLLFVMFNCIFVTFSCGILGHVWCLILSIPDLCRLYLFVVCDQQRRRPACVSRNLISTFVIRSINSTRRDSYM